MAVRIDPIPDDRAERIIADPAAYFGDARRRVRAVVEAEMASEAAARRGLLWWKRWRR